MDIAALSIGLSQTKLQQDSSLAVMKMAMDSAKEQGETVKQLLNPTTKTMEHSVIPFKGGNIDVRI